jgi:hypothetical protein
MAFKTTLTDVRCGRPAQIPRVAQETDVIKSKTSSVMFAACGTLVNITHAQRALLDPQEPFINAVTVELAMVARQFA